MKQKILNYLQYNLHDLWKKVPNLHNARYAEDPDRLVLEVTKKISPKHFPSEIKDFTIEVVEVEEPNIPVSKPSKAEEILKKYNININQPQEPPQVSDAISPLSSPKKLGPAYDAWRKRYGIK